MLTRCDELLKNHRGLAGALLFMVSFVVYAGSLADGFVYDDVLQILGNPFVRNLALWPRIFTGSVWSFHGGHETSYYRPLQILAYGLLYHSSGANPAAFHLFNLSLYAIGVSLVFRLGLELLQNGLAAFVGALLWILHPLHVEAVVWLASLPDVGFSLFYLAAFLLFLRAERADKHRAVRHGLAALVYFPALFFKEMALSFPLLLLAFWFFFPARESWRDRAVCSIPYAGATGVYLGIRVAALGHLSHAMHLWKVPLRVVGAAVGLLGQHTHLFFWPTHLNVFRTFDLASSLHSPWPWLTVLALVATCALPKREPVLGFLVVWWGVTLLPCLDVRQLSFPLLAERFSYLPSVGLCLAISWLCLIWLPRRAPRLELAPAALAGLALVMSLWLVQDLRAIPNWRDNDTLWNYSLQVSPSAGLVHANRGLKLQFRYGDLDGAAREYRTALRLNGASFQPLPVVTYDSYIGLGQIAFLKGREDEALDYFARAARVLPSHSLAYDIMGSIYFPRGNYAKAAEYFARAVGVSPYDLSARFYLGTCWMKLGRYREAAEQFRAAREVDPSYWQAFDAEARALEARGDSAGAARVRALKPSQ